MLIRNRLHSLALLLLLCCVLPVWAQAGLEQYARQDSGRFRVLYVAQDARVVPDLWKTIRSSVPAVEQRLRLALADTVMFVIAPTDKEWARLTRGAPLWANGLAYSQAGVAVLKSPRIGLPYGPMPLTAVHEYVHLLMSAGAPNAQFPRWLEEGLAQVLAGQIDYVDDASLGRAAVSGRVHSLPRLEGLMGMNAEEARQGYAESAVAVQLLEKRYGMAGISNLVHELRGGREYQEAFGTIFGISPGEFDAMYQSYVQRNFRLTFFGDTQLWVSVAFVVLVLAGGIALWLRRKKIKARWRDEERRERTAPEDLPPPPYIINYTIVRARREDEENDERGTMNDEGR